VGFLRVLLGKISGKIVLIWDGSPIHRAHQIQDFLKRGAAKRLHLDHLPGSAPDLNPDEGIWNDLKRVELGHVGCGNLDPLDRKLIQAKERWRHKKEIITSGSRQCGYLLSVLSARSVVSGSQGNCKNRPGIRNTFLVLKNIYT
jgi:DDE superfamily endonuclease